MSTRCWRLPWLLLLATPTILAADIHRCLGAGGTVVFQDQPCGTSGPGLRPAGTTSGFTRAKRTAPFECQLRSAVVPVYTRDANGDALLLDGGAALRIRASDSGLGLSMLLQVRRPRPIARSYSDAPQPQCRPWPPRFIGPPPPPPPECVPPPPLTLSSLLNGQALITQTGSHEPDAYKGPQELAFGYRRSGSILRHLRDGQSAQMRFRVSPLGWVYSHALPLTGLAQALKQLRACQVAAEVDAP